MRRFFGWVVLLSVLVLSQSVSADCQRIWADPKLPETLLSQLEAQGLQFYNRKLADCALELVTTDETAGALGWVYALAAPYPTVQDSLSLRNLKLVWQGQPLSFLDKLLVDAPTAASFAALWGEPSADTVTVTAAADQLKTAWEQPNTWAMLPFEQLEPRWKVIAVDGVSPYDFGFSPQVYPLTIWRVLKALKTNQESGSPTPVTLESNFNPEKMTTLTLTGTTAMVRRLAYAIEEKGADYPVANIAETLRNSDFTHISNEASFYEDCPPGIPLRREARFCSPPSYAAVLDDIGADIIELTGNHVLDWGTEPFLYTLKLYQQKGLKVYGGGITAAAGQEPIFLEHHGNRIALLGCNAIGPENILATADQPGAAPCNLPKMKEQIQQLSAEGWLVVVTFQHLEYDDYSVVALQSHDFFEVADAGPVIVSGSQAHIPQGFTFVGKTFIHFGLGNLLFDQTSDIERDSFFDRHIFYDGRYLGNVLETIRLEDTLQTRFLEGLERAEFLKLILNTCSWGKVFP